MISNGSKHDFCWVPTENINELVSCGKCLANVLKIFIMMCEEVS